MNESTLKVNRQKKFKYDTSGYYFLGLVTVTILGFGLPIFPNFLTEPLILISISIFMPLWHRYGLHY